MESFFDSYTALYKALATPEAAVGDLEQWMDIALNNSDAIERILNNGNLPRGKKYSLETSLGHFISIQLELSDRITIARQGGALVSDSMNNLNNMEVDDSPVNDQVNGSVDDSNGDSVKSSEINSAFKNRIKTGLITNIKHLDFDKFMNDAKVLFVDQITKVLKEFDSIKVNTAISAEYIIKKVDVDDKVDVKLFNTKSVSIFQTTDLNEVFEENIRQTLNKKMSEFEEQDSGWSLKRILHLAVNINKYNPMRVGSYIPLPKVIQNRKACINVKNKDEQCFKWAVLAGLKQNENENENKKKIINPERLHHYKPMENRLNFKGIEFPIKPTALIKFEKQNNVSINVYILKKFGDRFEVSPLHHTAFKQHQHVNLLLIQDHYVDENDTGEKESDDDFVLPKFHYVMIKSLSRLIGVQLSNKNGRCYICDRCLHYFRTQEKLDAHEIDCAQTNKCKIVLPKNMFLKFSKYNAKERVPIVIYADTECLIKPRSEDQPERVISNHQAFSIGYYMKCSFNDSLSKYEYYRQLDESMPSPAEWFVSKLKSIAIDFEEYLKDIKPMDLTDEDVYEYDTQVLCHICKMPFKERDPKVRDHCHLTGL